MKKTTPLFIFLSFFLVGCNLTPEFYLPETEIPECWKNVDAEETLFFSDCEWWEQFSSEELSLFIAEASRENNDLLAAFARMKQAEALAKIAGATLYPNISLEGDIQRNYGRPGNTSSYTIGVQTAYELDLFGKLRNQTYAAIETLNATAYDLDALRLSITSQVAIQYFNLLSLYERVAIAEKNLKNISGILKTIQVKFDAGAISQIELSEQKILVANENARLISLKQELEISHNLLAILLNMAPVAFDLKSSFLESFTFPEIIAICPGELIAHRPDIASLEAQLSAANFNIGVARANFFPSLTLSASTFLSASPASAAATTISSLAASIAAPLFTGGRLEGVLENATARQLELIANYRGAILTAYSEVENAFYNVENSDVQTRYFKVASDEAKKSFEAAMTRFNAGAIDYLTLLTAQNSLLRAEDSLIQALASRLIARVELFKALGGGW